MRDGYVIGAVTPGRGDVQRAAGGMKCGRTLLGAIGFLALMLAGGCGSLGTAPTTLYSGGESGGSAARLAELAQRTAALEEASRRRDEDLARLQQAVRAALADRDRLGDELAGLKQKLESSDTAQSRRMLALVRRLDALNARLEDLEAMVGGLNRAARSAEEEARAVRALINREEAEKLDAEDGAAASAVEAATAGERFGLHLASYRDAAAARKGWQILLGKYADLLRDLEPRLEAFDLGTLGGHYLRLVAGPFADVAPARERCAALRAAGAFCQVAAFKGQPLG